MRCAWSARSGAGPRGSQGGQRPSDRDCGRLRFENRALQRHEVVGLFFEHRPDSILSWSPRYATPILAIRIPGCGDESFAKRSRACRCHRFRWTNRRGTERDRRLFERAIREGSTAQVFARASSVESAFPAPNGSATAGVLPVRPWCAARSSSPGRGVCRGRLLVARKRRVGGARRHAKPVMARGPFPSCVLDRNPCRTYRLTWIRMGAGGQEAERRETEPNGHGAVPLIVLIPEFVGTVSCLATHRRFPPSPLRKAGCCIWATLRRSSYPGQVMAVLESLGWGVFALLLLALLGRSGLSSVLTVWSRPLSTANRASPRLRRWSSVLGHTQESAAEVRRGTPVRCRETAYSRSSTMPDQESLNQRPEALATEAREMPAVNHANGKREQPLHAPHVVVDRGVPCVRDERAVVDGVA